jgi:hypothetical protein
MTTLFPALSRLAQDEHRPRQAEGSCDLCGESILADHRHLLELTSYTVHCSCQACAILFEKREASLGKYRLIPDRRLWLREFPITDAQWTNLHIPVGLAFVTWSTTHDPVARYPSPMGTVESAFDGSLWSEWTTCRTDLGSIQPDVEALLINRARGARLYFIVPIDDCFRLAALVGRHWKGLSGGQEVWKKVDRFFDRLTHVARSHSPAD